MANETMASCPKCDGYPELDECGVPYTCYFCCNTGRVPASVADAYNQEIRDFEERFAPRRLGIYVRPMQDEYDFDELDHPAPGNRLFSRLIPRQRPVHAPVAAGYDDIPF